MVAVDAKGDLCAGCSTSGLAFKIKGRVGDSPIPGAGAYVDNEIGGAAATGNGDIMMRFCVSLMAVEYMRAGASPSDACARSLQRIEAKGYKTQACLVALNKKGEFGAARIGLGPFPFAIRNGTLNELRQV
jgi:isoaspartyl peptidase/L-asparaginase-like protein (Ntn-hydrolase superfamily)